MFPVLGVPLSFAPPLDIIATAFFTYLGELVIRLRICKNICLNVDISEPELARFTGYHHIYKRCITGRGVPLLYHSFETVDTVS